MENVHPNFGAPRYVLFFVEFHDESKNTGMLYIVAKDAHQARRKMLEKWIRWRVKQHEMVDPPFLNLDTENDWIHNKSFKVRVKPDPETDTPDQDLWASFPSIQQALENAWIGCVGDHMLYVPGQRMSN